jgi:hypothetical protein
LVHQQIARSMLHQLTLLLSDRFADRLGVGGIILVTV